MKDENLQPNMSRNRNRGLLNRNRKALQESKNLEDLLPKRLKDELKEEKKRKEVKDDLLRKAAGRIGRQKLKDNIPMWMNLRQMEEAGQKESVDERKFKNEYGWGFAEEMVEKPGSETRQDGRPEHNKVSKTKNDGVAK